MGSSPSLRLCGALQQFWRTRGHFAEGRGWCDRVLRNTASEERTQEHATVLGAAGQLAYYQADYPAAQAQLNECLAIRRQLGDRKGSVAALANLGLVAMDQGNYPAALKLYEENLAIFRELGDRSGIAATLSNMGAIARQQGDNASARAFQEESLALRRELGDRGASVPACTTWESWPMRKVRLLPLRQILRNVSQSCGNWRPEPSLPTR